MPKVKKKLDHQILFLFKYLLTFHGPRENLPVVFNETYVLFLSFQTIVSLM